MSTRSDVLRLRGNLADLAALAPAFAPKRWELIGKLREIGPVSVAELTRQLGRDYKNVHGDVEKLADCFLASIFRAFSAFAAPYQK